ncbi:ATP-binding cassette domain-containing protein [Cupriavidus basilensis]
MNAPVLSARKLTRRFGGLTAVGDVDIDLALHEIHAVIGTNGAGKSTLINMLSGELPPSSGRLQLQGRDVTGWSQPRAGARRRWPQLPAQQYLPAADGARELPAGGPVARAAAWRLWEDAQRCRTSRALGDEALECAGLAGCADTVATALSHGQKRQLEVAMCLATQPTVLLLDEPLAGMGAEESARMLALACARCAMAMRYCWSSTTWRRFSRSPTVSP